MKNKEKYDLRNIAYALEHDKGECDFVIYHNLAEIHRENFYGIKSVGGAFTKWLEEEYKPQILDDVEKDYLSAVIKPFRKDIKYIVKFKRYSDKKEYIYMTMKKDDDYCTLPVFEKGTMYKGMRMGKRYTLKELGL